MLSGGSTQRGVDRSTFGLASASLSVSLALSLGDDAEGHRLHGLRLVY